MRHCMRHSWRPKFGAISLIELVAYALDLPLSPRKAIQVGLGHLAVGFQQVWWHLIACSRYGLKSQLSFSRIIRTSTRLDTKHAPSQCCSTTQSALPYLRLSCRASTAVVPQAKHNTAQRAQQPCTKQQIKYVPIRARQRKQADRVGESQQVVEHFIEHSKGDSTWRADARLRLRARP